MFLCGGITGNEKKISDRNIGGQVNEFQRDTFSGNHCSGFPLYDVFARISVPGLWWEEGSAWHCAVSGRGVAGFHYGSAGGILSEGDSVSDIGKLVTGNSCQYAGGYPACMEEKYFIKHCFGDDLLYGIDTGGILAKARC